MGCFKAMTIRFCVLLLAVLCGERLIAAGDTLFEVPEGFEVTLWADDDLATNIYAMTTDSRGRIVVAGPDYIKTLIDSDWAWVSGSVFSGKRSGLCGRIGYQLFS